MDIRSYTIHDLPQEERPRERLRKVGSDYLSAGELLALLIERGRPGKSALIIAQNLISRFGGLVELKDASLIELQQVDGIGFATACKLQAAFKIGEKASNGRKKYGEILQSAEDVFKLLRYEIGTKRKEHFQLISLTTRAQLIAIDEICVGTLSMSIAHPREVFRAAIKNAAQSCVLVHNHPSGNPEPSSADIQVTKKMNLAGELLDLRLTDHIIVTRDSYWSSRENGII